VNGVGPAPESRTRWLITGASGRLGRELAPLFPGALTPSARELDIGDPAAVAGYFAAWRPTHLLHAAAYTDVAGAERAREACWRVNVLGTRHLAAACRSLGATLVHISTDYVFYGDLDAARAARGGYREGDPTGPPRNAYAQSKLEAEGEARRSPRHLIIRTSFRPRSWPYPTAFTDVRTSQGYVDEIAPEVALAARHVDALLARGVALLHIAGAPTSIFDLARRRRPEVLPASKRAADVDLPDDIVLDSSCWRRLRATLSPLSPC